MSARDDLRIGIIGAGNIASWHARSYAAVPGCTVVALADTAPDRAKARAQEWGVPRAFDNPSELLNDPGIDAVSICTWNNTHAPFAIEAVNAGKHVLVEKPMCRTLAEAQALRDACAERPDVILEIGYVRRHSPNAQLLVQQIQAGALGELYYARAAYLLRAGNPGGWFANRALSGGGPMIDLGVHLLDMCWYLMGCPVPATVSANTYHRLGPRTHVRGHARYQVVGAEAAVCDVEDMANAMIRFEGGGSLLLESSYSLHATRDSTMLSVFGDRGGADLEPELMFASEHGGVMSMTIPQLAVRGFESEAAFRNQIQHFVDVCNGEAQPMAPVDQGVDVMKMIDAIYRSADIGTELHL